MLAAIHLNNYAKLSTRAHIEINIKYIKIKWITSFNISQAK